MSLISSINVFVPEGWHVVTMSALDSVGGVGWLVQLCDGGNIANGTGETLEEAFEECAEHIAQGKTVGRLAVLRHAVPNKPDLNALLPEQPVYRRF